MVTPVVTPGRPASPDRKRSLDESDDERKVGVKAGCSSSVLDKGKGTRGYKRQAVGSNMEGVVEGGTASETKTSTLASGSDHAPPAHSMPPSAEATSAKRRSNQSAATLAAPPSANASSSSAANEAHSQDVNGANRAIGFRAIISSKEAGVVIGKNGKNVADIRDKSGAKVMVSEQIPAALERIVTATGSLDAISKAFGLMALKIVEEQTGAVGSATDVKQRAVALKLLIPHARMGSVIGKSGQKIKEIQDASGSKILACEDILPNSTERIVTVTGVSDAIHIAAYHIGLVLLEHPERAIGTIPYKPMPGVVTGQQGGGSATRSVNASATLPSNPSNVNAAPAIVGHAGVKAVGVPVTVAAHAHGVAMAGAYLGGMAGAMGAYPAYGHHPMQRATVGAGAGLPPHPGSIIGLHIPGAPGLPVHGFTSQQIMATTAAVMGQAVGLQMQVQQIFIPNEMVGAIIGKGGQKINEIRQLSGCLIKIMENVEGSTERLVTITGSPECNQMALYLLYQRLESEKLRMQTQRMATGN
ncbi:hypothetical protein HK101_009271 [Irineochytrium annulatum]|nr:hypothetical protein HK101_009271 [Irineochytrium annulatum]